MKILITGGSSGIGYAFAKYYSRLGHELYLVAREKKNLEEAKKNLGGNIHLYSKDLSKTEDCFSLYEEVKNENIDMLINSAGIGLHGKFLEENIEDELKLIQLNIEAVQILTNLFLKDFKKKNAGTILNISSTAAFSPGPLMATYFASKAYILRLTEAIWEEVKEEGANVYICCLCPGPVNTSFNDKLGVKFKKAQNSEELVVDAVKQMKKKKVVIIPTFGHKLNAFGNKFVPRKMLLKANYNVQIQKIENAKK